VMTTVVRVANTYKSWAYLVHIYAILLNHIYCMFWSVE
jgi:hypothetical protein